jgi:lysophospholipase L1-like esterase
MSHRVYVLGTIMLAVVVAFGAASARAQTHSTNVQLATAPPTNTRRPTKTFTATATPVAIQARLCDDCTRVRLRASPGTAGEVVDFLDSSAELVIMGRSNDSQWLYVRVVGSGTPGWVSAQFVRLADGQPLDDSTLSALPVLGVSVEASPTPTSSLNIPGWLSGVTSHSHQIFVKGQSLGNRANVFSKVGDSITVSPYFLTPIGFGQYDLGAYGSLSRVVAYYSQANARTANSFANQSLAAGGGWSASTLLEPQSANKAVCDNDAPLVCEYRIVKPAVALIMVGTNDSGSGSAEQFAGNVRQIVQISIDMGVIPVLSTLPPKRIDAEQTARVDAFNKVIHAIAQQYDVPLWDYWSLMEIAPNGGMSKDGLHPSVPPDGAAARFTADNLQYGYTIRNLSALQVLDVMWRVVLS